jgi:class 3 adenylate cyclase/pimeloyl-ACP methyl ester carboxylesterase
VDIVDTRFARVGRERVAYQVVGDAPTDLVFTSGSYANVDLDWDDPSTARFLRRLASFTRLIRFDRRGTGSSDRFLGEELPPWESYVEEVEAVMAAVGSARAAIFGMFDAGPMAALFAASKPERTSALILANTGARYTVADDYPIGVPYEMVDQLVQVAGAMWGTEGQVPMLVPSRANDEAFKRWFARYLRAVAPPASIETHLRAAVEADARSILPAIHVPTLVLHRASSPISPVAHGRFLAEHIEGAKLVEVPGSDAPLYWENADAFLDAIEEFLTGIRRGSETNRVLATVLFSDIVGSTALASRLGDTAWRELIDRHDDTARRQIEASQGRLIKTTGDGIVATFDGPGRAIRSVLSLRGQLGAIGLTIRAGLHAGEIELRSLNASSDPGGHLDIGGIAVHISARVMALADPNDVLVSQTVKDLVVGSGLEFEDSGEHVLKGVPDRWRLYRVVG